MTVRQLIIELQKLDPDRRIIIDKGGHASPLDRLIDDCAYRAESTWHGELKHPDDKTPDDEVVVVLYPVN